jgi:hypothetical protein
VLAQVSHHPSNALCQFVKFKLDGTRCAKRLVAVGEADPDGSPTRFGRVRFRMVNVRQRV